jgi:hypothetical protein
MRLSFLGRKKKSEKKGIRILYTTDLHGAEIVWRKSLSAAKIYNVDALIVGGDITGKMLIPIVKVGEGKYEYYFMKKIHHITQSELQKVIDEIYNMGYYPYVTNEDEYRELAENKDKLDEVFLQVMKDTLVRWLDLANDRLPDNIQLIVTMGNDDRLELDEVLVNHPRAEYSEGRVIYIKDKYEFFGCSWVNPTPWDSPREESEEELYKRLNKYWSMIKDPRRTVLEIHAPPFQSTIDEAPLLDENFNPVVRSGRVVKIPVGSKAVKKFIKEKQPLLVLSGHIHESPGSVKIGKTWVVNPGSEYSEAIFKGFLIDIDDTEIKAMNRIEG